MAFRGGLGPVFAYEWLTATRRWQMYAGRAGFVGLLLVGLVFVWANGFPNGASLPTYRAQAEIGELVWFGVGDDWASLAPSLAEAIFPDLMARGILSWP